MVQAEKTCPRHEGQSITGHCGHCGAPICRECTGEFGYFCSVACLNESRGGITTADRQAHSRAEQELRRAAWLGRTVVFALLALFLYGVGYLVWRFYLDPSGKVCWSWSRQVETFAIRIIGQDNDSLVVRVADEIVTLDLKKGSVRGTVSLPGGTDGRGMVEAVDGGFLVVGPNAITRYGSNGAEIYKRSTKWYRLGTCRAPDQTREFMCLSPPVSKEYLERRRKQGDDVSVRKAVLSCLDLVTGKPVWSVPLAANESIREMVASEQMLYALSTVPAAAGGVTAVLRAYVAGTGVASWEAELPESPRWGPHVSGDVVMVDIAGMLHAFTVSGTEAWSAEAGTEYGGRRIMDGMLLVSAKQSTACYDTASGKRRWRFEVPLVVDSASLDGNRLFALGFIPAAAAKNVKEGDNGKKLPKAFEENKDVLDDLGINLADLGGRKAPPVPVLFCLDAQDGTEKWRVPKVIGTLCAEGGRLVMVIDTVQTSMLERVTGGEGVLVIRQYDPDDGSMLYSRQSDIGLHRPTIHGDRLVGVWFERTEKPSMLGGFGTLGAGGGFPKALGIIAFKLR